MSLTWSPPNAAVYTEVSGTFTFSDDDVRAVYIDWDDGASNKKADADYQWWTTTEPTTSAVLTHTYTATGNFNPIVQVINADGMASKYHRRIATTEVSPSVIDSGLNQIAIRDGTATALLRTENRTVLSGIDNAIFEESGARDLYVALAPTVPLASLDTIASGTGLSLTVKVLVEDYIDTTAGPITKNSLVSVRDISVKIPDTTWQAAVGGLKVNDDTFLIRKVLRATLDTCKPALNGATAVTNNDLNKLKAFFFTTGSFIPTIPGIANKDSHFTYPITYLSFGCPVKKLEDNDRYILMDFTQSRAKASNTTISQYFYDLGKIWMNPKDAWEVAPFGAAPVYTTPSAFTSGTVTANNTKKVHYTYTPRPDGLINSATGAIGTPDRYEQAFNLNTATSGCASWYLGGDDTVDRADQFLIDDFGRLADQYHLLRIQAEPNSGDTYKTSLEGFAGIYRLTPPPNWGASGSGYPGAGTDEGAAQVMLSGGSAAKFYQNAPADVTTVFTNATTSGSYSNCTPTVGQISGTNRMNKLSGTNVDMVDYGTGTTAGFTYTNVTGGAREAHEYLMAISSRKTNKIFFNATPLAKSFTSEMGTASRDSTQIMGVYYLKVNNKATFNQTCEWVPLEFEDTTKVEQEYRDTTNKKYKTRSASLARSGYITFDMPDDWDKISISGLTGGMNIGENENPGMVPITGARPVDANYEIELGSAPEPLLVHATGGLFGAAKYGRCVTITGAAIGSALSGTYSADDIGAYKTLAIMISSSASNWVDGTLDLTPADSGGRMYSGNQAGYAFWVASGGANGYDGGDSITLQIGQGGNIGATWTSGNLENYTFNNVLKEGPYMNYGMWNADDEVHMKLRNVGMYDVFDGPSKVFVTLTGSAYNTSYTTVDARDEDAWENLYGFEDNSNGVATEVSGTWGNTEYYPLKIVLSGSDWTKFYHNNRYLNRGVDEGAVLPASQSSGVELWNILPADNAFSQIIKEEDDSAFNLSRLPITSDLSFSRAGNFYEAITRKGKVIVVKTGVSIQEITFSSVALGDEGAADAFTKYGAEGTLYNYLHKIRRIMDESVPVFWDERQKDGTYVRFWGVVKNVNESHSEGGPRGIKNFDFSMVVKKIALIDVNGILMAGPLPLGGIEDERNFT